MKFILDRSTAEDTLEDDIKENFDEHSWIIGVLAGSDAVLNVEHTQIRFIDDCTDNPGFVVRRDKFIEREGGATEFDPDDSWKPTFRTMISLQKPQFRILSDYNCLFYNNTLAGRFVPTYTERVCEGLESLGGKLWV